MVRRGAGLVAESERERRLDSSSRHW